MDVFDKYYRNIKFCLSIIGCWSYNSGLKQRIPQLIIISCIMANLILQSLHTFIIRLDLDEFLACCPPLLLNIICICQLLTYIICQNKVRKILDAMKNNWDVRANRESDVEIMRRFANTGNFYHLLYSVNAATAVITVVLMSLTNPMLDLVFPLNETRPRQPVFDLALPFDQNKYFYWVFVYAALTGAWNISAMCTCESFFAIATIHACGLFSIVSSRLKKIAELLNSKTINEDKNLINTIRQELFYSIENHTCALNFARTLDSFYSPYLFTTVLLTVLTLSTSGFGILISLGELNKCIRYSAYTVGVFVRFYCISLPSQALIDHSMEVTRSAYEACWYKIPVKSRKLILLLIQRSQEPCKMTALKFYNVDMETFSALVQTSVSFFTVLFSMR